MNPKIQNYPQYNSINTTLPKYSNPNFGGKCNVRYLHNEVETSKVRLKFSDTLTKLSLWVFRMAEKVSKKGKIDTQNQSFEKEKIIRTLTKELNLANGKIEQIIKAHENEEINPVKRERIYEEIKNSELNYNPMLPYIEMSKPMYKPEKYKYKYEDIKTGTSNRADMKPLVIPEITQKGFYFELPKGEMKVKKVKLKEFKEPFELQSNISDKYNSSLSWNTDKIARDLLQNFFDGHGQTLDGVKFVFSPMGSGKYRVRIEGKSTYNYKEAVLLGESSSHENIKAAGNYGEGLKMVTLKLLKDNDGKTSQVKIGSGNWEVTCGLKKDERLDSEVMNYKISPVKEFDGNFIEFDTSNITLLQTIRKFINRFYHSSNPHFEAPDFENDLFGFKVLPKGEFGGLYISGQQFEYEGEYDGIAGSAVFIKEKIPPEYYDVSRDRVSVTSSNWVIYITKWLFDRIDNAEDRMRIIKSLERFANSECAMNKLLDRFVDDLGYDIHYNSTGAIKFPDNYVAQNTIFTDLGLMYSMASNGYKVFPRGYEKLGMNSISNLIKKAQQHEVLEPTETEKQKIQILKRALKLFSNLEGTHFLNRELDTKIYIFDRKSKKENSIDKYENTIAEAIIDSDTHSCKGFYIDREYINKNDFGRVLETTLHELSHKEGGDGSKDFGYKLTSVNGNVFDQIFNEHKVAEELRILNDIWKKL